MRFLYFLVFLLPLSLKAQEASISKSFSTEKQNVLALASSPDGKWIASGGDDNQIIFRDSESGNQLFTLKGHKDWVTAITFSEFDDDLQKYFVSGSKDGHVIVYDIEKRNIIFQNKSHDKTVNQVKIIQSLNYLVSVSTDGTLVVIDLNTKQQINKITASNDPVLHVVAIPGTNTIATSDAQGKIKFWDVLTGNMDKIIDAHDSYARGAEIIDNQVISISDDKSIKIWDLTTGNAKSTIEKAHKKWIHVIENPGDNVHYATGGHDGMVQLWSKDKTEPIASVKQNGSFVTGLSFAPDLKKLYSVGFGGDIQVIDISAFGLKAPAKSKKALSGLGSGSKSSKVQHDVEENDIFLVQPYMRSGDTYYTLDENIKLSGQLLAKASIREFKIVNKATGEEDRLRTTDDLSFEHLMPLRYKNNEIEIKFTDVHGDAASKTLIVHRIFDKNNLDDLLKLSRNGRDYALIIATNDYENIGDLTNPVFDATTIAAELKNNYGFEVEKIINPPLDDIKLKIKEYSKRMYADEDQLFIFIAGHGEYDEFFKEGYLVATNSKAEDEARSSYLPHSSLRTYVNNIPCNHIFLTMDVCFGGTFDPFIAKRGNEAKQEQVQKLMFIKRKLKYKTRIYLTSGGKEYVPDGRPGHHSPFARKFIEALRTYGGADGVLTYKDIMGNVETVVPEPRTGEFGDNEPGSDFLFIYR